MGGITSRHFTIIIPTRERKDTLVYTIRSALAQDYDNFTVLVSDNASTDGTSLLVEAFDDKRLKYINTGERVSMSHNWEFALNQIKDGWVTILGDDDAILPGTLKKVNIIIDETGVLAIRSNGCSYRWPNLDGAKYGELSLSLRRGYKRISTRDVLDSALNGKISYTRLPVLYNGGFVDSSLLKKAKEISGSIIKSRIPDVYLGVVFSLLIDEYVYSDEPLAINGASQHSGGTAFMGSSKQATNYDPFSKFINETNIPFHSDLPLMPNGMLVRSLQVLLYESYLQANQFHFLRKHDINRETQLCTILKNAGRFQSEVELFAKRFSAQHHINFEEIKKKSHTKRFPIAGRFFELIFKWPNRQINRVLSLWSKWISIDGDPMLPLENVFEASIVAGLLKKIPVGGPYWNIKNLFKRKNGNRR